MAKKKQRRQNKKIPLGITLLGIILAGIIGAFSGVYSSVIFSNFGTLFMILRSSFLFIAGIFSFILAYGLWKGAKWGWWLGIIVSIALILTLIVLNFLCFILGVIIFYYLMRQKTRKYFNVFTAQSAIEYITTYSWAIVIICIVAAGLYIFISSPTQVPSNTCSFASGVSCQDVVIMAGGGSAEANATTVAFIFTNAQDAPIKNPVAYVQFNNKNVSAQCTPNFVLAGGSIVCTAGLPEKLAVGSLLSGSTYLNVTYCGLSTHVHNSNNCTGGLYQTYSGSFVGHLQPFSSLQESISLTAQNYTQNANNNPDQLTASVMLFGIPLKGATVNFTSNNINFVINPRLALTNNQSDAISSIYGSTNTNVYVVASYGQLTSNVVISFVGNPIAITFVANNFTDCSTAASTASIDNVPYTCSQLSGKQFSFTKGSKHTYSFTGFISPAIGTRVAFNNLTIQGIPYRTLSGTFVASQNTTIPFNYYTQYLLIESANPNVGGAAVPGGSEYLNASSSVTISETANSAWTFNGWTGSGTGSYTGNQPSAVVIMNGPLTETAQYKVSGSGP